MDSPDWNPDGESHGDGDAGHFPDQPEAHAEASSEFDHFGRALEKWQHLMAAGRLDLAEAELRNALRELPEHPALHALLAWTLEDLGRPEEAEASARAALHTDPGNSLALGVLARLRIDAGRHHEAEAIILDGLRQDPHDSGLLLAYGQLLLRTQHHAKAESVVRRVLAADPEEERAHQMLAFILGDAIRGGQAKQSAARSMEIDPDAAHSHLAMGLTLLRNGRPFGARRHLRTALTIDPTLDTAQEVYLVADRACRPVFLPMYYWTLLIDRLPGKQFTLWGVFVAFIYTHESFGISDAIADPIIWSYIGFAIYTWLSEAIVSGWVRMFPAPLTHGQDHTMSDPVLDALRDTLEREPGNHALWVRYGEMLHAAGRPDDAAAALKQAITAGADARATGIAMLPFLRDAGALDEALIRAETLLEQGDDPAIRIELARIHDARGSADEAAEVRGKLPGAGAGDGDTASRDDVDDADDADEADDDADAAVDADGTSAGFDALQEAMTVQGQEVSDLEAWASQFDWGDLRVTFDDVAGLEEPKKQIHLRVVAPFANPELYRAFRRTGGGGLLLYGPPGCGKTYLARATAGEVGANFIAVGIHEVLDKWWGESEKAVHALFDQARRNAPCVLFFDEFDALGTTRGSGGSQGWKNLVNQLLQEMDGIGGANDDVLVFASTNAPWNVDSAFRRPGRFDRLLFVPPPELPARAQILNSLIRNVPGGDTIDIRPFAQRTALMTGADLKALAERAAERALSRSLEHGSVLPVTQDDFEAELKALRSSASEWLATARNYARYSNEGGQYDELAEYLKRHKKW